MNAGWPRVNLERLRFEHEGVSYRYTSFRYINEVGADSSIPPAALEELELLTMSYSVAVAPFPSLVLDELVSEGPVTDRVRIYRFKDRPANEVIVVDQCPADLHGEQYVLYEPRGDSGASIEPVSGRDFALGMPSGNVVMPPLPSDGTTLEDGTPGGELISRQRAVDLVLERFDVLGLGRRVRDNPDKYPISVDFRYYSNDGSSGVFPASKLPVWVVVIDNLTIRGVSMPPEVKPGAFEFFFQTVAVVDARTGQQAYGFEYGRPETGLESERLP